VGKRDERDRGREIEIKNRERARETQVKEVGGRQERESIIRHQTWG
jgi:hypothetical protein